MPAFKVDYECRNCKKKFTEEYEKGDEVKEHSIFRDVFLKSHKCDDTVCCKHCRDIECPTCGSGKITIIKRSPLK